MDGYASFNLATELLLRSQKTKIKSINGLVKSSALSFFSPNSDFRANVKNLKVDFPDKT